MQKTFKSKDDAFRLKLKITRTVKDNGKWFSLTSEMVVPNCTVLSKLTSEQRASVLATSYPYGSMVTSLFEGHADFHGLKYDDHSEMLDDITRWCNACFRDENPTRRETYILSTGNLFLSTNVEKGVCAKIDLNFVSQAHGRARDTILFGNDATNENAIKGIISFLESRITTEEMDTMKAELESFYNEHFPC